MRTAVQTTQGEGTQWGWVTAAVEGFLTLGEMASSAAVGASMMALGSNAVEAGLLIIHWCAVVMLRGGKCTHMSQVREGRDCFCLEKTVKPKLQKSFHTETNFNLHY